MDNAEYMTAFYDPGWTVGFGQASMIQNGKFRKELNRLEKEGWELVSLQFIDNGVLVTAKKAK